MAFIFQFPSLGHKQGSQDPHGHELGVDPSNSAAYFPLFGYYSLAFFANIGDSLVPEKQVKWEGSTFLFPSLPERRRTLT